MVPEGPFTQSPLPVTRHVTLVQHHTRDVGFGTSPVLEAESSLQGLISSQRGVRTYPGSPFTL